MPQFKAPSCASTSTSCAASSESSSSDNAERNEALALKSCLESQLPHHPDDPSPTTTYTTGKNVNDARPVTIVVSRSSSSATARSSMYSDFTNSDCDLDSRTDSTSLPCSSSVSSSSSSYDSNAHLLHQDNHQPRRVTGVPTTGSELTFSPLPSSSTKHHLQGGLHLGRETINHKRQCQRQHQHQLHRLTRDISTLTRAARVAGRYSARRVQRSLETLCGVLAVLDARERRRREITKGKGKGMRKLTMGMGMGTGVGTGMESGDDGDDGLRGESGFVDDGGVGGGAKVRFMGEQGHGHRCAGEENVRNDEVGETRARKGPGAAKVRKWLRAVLRT